MSWKIIEKYRKVLASESGVTVKNWGGKLTVCLVYPNRYRTAMSNLGFQAVYGLFNGRRDVLCERAFLPDPDELKEYEKTRTPLLSLESQRPLADFDVIAFSVSFESDYLHIPAMLRLAGIPSFSAARTGSMPLVMGGGAALFLNPEPVADFMDLVAVGEGEAILPPLVELLTSEGDTERDQLLRKTAQLPGIYVPSRYEAQYDGPSIVGFTHRAGTPPVVKRVWEPAIDRHPTTSVILTPTTEFSDMYLIELSRGCPRGCRFCAAGFIYLPYRQRSLEEVKDEVERGLESKKKLGLVGAAVADYRGIGELSRHILEKGGKVSVSSLRIDALDDEMIDVLVASGHKTVALAPEGASQRLRDLIRKGISEEQILAACDRLVGKGILNLKLYFIIGLPTETDADLHEMVDLVRNIRERVIAAAREQKRLGEITLSVNPFIPKPFTPFQWCGMEEGAALERKGRFLRQALRPLSNVTLQMESPKDAYLQALLSRGDRRLSSLLVKADELGSWRRAAKALSFDTDLFVHRHIPLDELLPWDFIDSGGKEPLIREYRRAFGNET